MRSNQRRLAILAAALSIALGGAGVNASLHGGFLGRALHRATPRLRLVVNVPAYRLDVYRDGKLVEFFNVTIGRPGHETPPGSYRIRKIVWNPWWHPPDSRWARGQPPEPPGPHNPMGRVKMYFSDLLYVHGTADVGDIAEPASHGCVRMKNADAIRLARLVERAGAPGAVDVDRLLAHPQMTRTVRLDTPIPLEVSYRLAEVWKGRLQIHPDVYHRRKEPVRAQVADALEARGYSLDDIDANRLDALIERARTSGISVPLDELIPGAGVGAAGDGEPAGPSGGPSGS